MIDLVSLKQTAPDLLALAQPLTTLRKVSASDGGEWAGPCPFCKMALHDGFRVQPRATEPRWLCRKCTDGKWKDVIEFVQRRDGVEFRSAVEALFGRDVQVIDPAVAAAARAEIERHQAEQAEQERIQQEARRHDLDASHAWMTYYREMDTNNLRGLWHDRGLTDLWIDYFQVGVCTSREYIHDGQPFKSPSLTIPTFRPTFNPDPTAQPSIAWQCVGLVHRLLLPDAPGGKYRPHIAGTGKVLFNADLYMPLMGDILLVEGEIKAMVTWANIQGTGETGRKVTAGDLLARCQVVGIAGKSFKSEWVGEFSRATNITICLDPDATSQAEQIARMLGADRCRVIDLPGKIDDMLIEKSLTVERLGDLVATARRVR